MGTLYLVGTPIGNLEDMSPRALRVLQEVDLIAAENPSRTQRLLARYDIHTPMVRYTDAYDRRKKSRIQRLLTALEQGDVALVSEAGMPGLADPGYELLAVAHSQNVPVIPVPGPTALATTLSLAGLSDGRFMFLGFLPRSGGARRSLIASVADSPFTLVAYEAPHRLLSALVDLNGLMGDRSITIAGELTKLYEDVVQGAASELLVHYQTHPPRGEFTLVIAPLKNVVDGQGGDL